MQSAFPYRFSIVVPTYNRREVLRETLARVGALVMPWACELIVVVDGSTDGSACAVRELTLPLPTRVLVQENQGAAAARNRGAEHARGEFLLFLDDDMMADPLLLVEHDKVLQQGADAVVGHIPLDPDSPRTVLTRGVDRWARRRHARLVSSGGQLTLPDLLTGQLSVRSGTFFASGAFDPFFNREGTFGGEDTDYLWRLLNSGARVRFAPMAVSYQRYVVTPEQYLRQWRQAGRADAMLIRKHPELATSIVQHHLGKSPVGRLLRHVAAFVPARVCRQLASPVVERAGAGRADWATQWAFTQVRDAVYWRGFGEAPPPTVVLAYHGIEPDHDSSSREYSVSPDRFELHLDALTRAGITFIGADALLDQLAGGPVLEGSVLLTFDDGYTSVLQHAAPRLHELDIPAVVFPVTDRVGCWNTWDAPADSPAQRPLLDVDQLRGLVGRGWEVGAHSRTHTHLTQLPGPVLRREIERVPLGSGRDRLPPARLLAYPYGQHDARVRSAARKAGYVAAFGLQSGSRGSGRSCRHAIPRVEVKRDTTPDELVRLVRSPPRAPLRSLRQELVGAARMVADAALEHLGGVA